MASVAGRALGFIRRQKRAFKVNIVRNVLQYFSLGLTYQYQSVYIAELAATDARTSRIRLGAMSRCDA